MYLVPAGLPQVGHPVVFRDGRYCGTIAKWRPDSGSDAHSWVDGDWVATVTGCYTESEDRTRVSLPDQGVVPGQIRSFYSWANSLVGWWEVVECDEDACRFYAMVPSHSFPHLPVKSLMAPFLPPLDRRESPPLLSRVRRSGA